MFVDKVQVRFKAGNGGNGVVSFRQEKFVDRGGPDGGDGGDGGDIILQASRNENTLVHFRYQKEVEAPAGKPGFKNRKHGRSGLDVTVAVPVGTVISDEHGTVLADLTIDGQEVVIASGGKGGYGNAHFVNSTRQAPRIAEKGEPGDELTATLELKMIAEVGLVGLPNAGKSSFLASISNARPEVANYPFTTLEPHLGVVDVDKDTSLLMADIPGLIEGASHGKGLGDEFLRHVERTAVLIHLIDAYNDDVAAAYRTIQQELAAYQTDLTTKPQLVALTKIEGLDETITNDLLAQLRKAVPKGTPLFAISAHSKQGVPELLYAVKEVVTAARAKAAAELKPEDSLPVLRLTRADEDTWTLEKTDKGWVVRGGAIERFASRTDFGNNPALERFRDILRRKGVLHELTRQDAQDGDEVYIGSLSGPHVTF